MNNLFTYIPLLVQGATLSIAAWITSGLLSLLVGIGLGTISCSYLASAQVLLVIRFYTFIARGVPAYVLILMAYFVLPTFLGINLPGFVAAAGALAFSSSGYVTEIVRAGLNSIALEQWQACFVLGYPLRSALIRIILPQALRNALPALFGELEQLLKSTSLLATIGVTELTRTGLNIISRELNPLPVYCAVAAIYLSFSALLQIIGFYTERKLSYGNR